MADDPQVSKATVTRLGTPSAFILLLGLGLVYYALRGWDIKYKTFNGTFAGTASPSLAGADVLVGGIPKRQELLGKPVVST